MPIDSDSIAPIANEFLAFYNIHFDELAVHFVETKEMCALHYQFFDDASPTDCMSFPMDDVNDEGYKIMGDIFICPEAAIHHVAEKSGEVYQEVTLYLIHGMLHLIGYDDLSVNDRAKMRAEETRFLSHLAKKKLLLHA